MGTCGVQALLAGAGEARIPAPMLKNEAAVRLTVIAQANVSPKAVHRHYRQQSL